MKISEILFKAAELLEPEGAWTRGGTRVASGCTTWSEDPLAVSFCAVAAISRTAGGWATDAAQKARDTLRAILGLAPSVELGADWNDSATRTQAEVVSALRTAATKAQEQGL